MNFNPISVTDVTPLVLDLNALRYNGGRLSELALLTVAVDTGGSTLYYGDTPTYPQATPLVVSGLYGKVGSKRLAYRNVATGQLASGAQAVMAGMIFEDSSDTNMVLGVTAEHILLQEDILDVADGGSISFYQPAISATNGIGIAAGGRETFEPSESNKYLNGSMTFVVASGTAVVRIRYRHY